MFHTHTNGQRCDHGQPLVAIRPPLLVNSHLKGLVRANLTLTSNALSRGGFLQVYTLARLALHLAPASNEGFKHYIAGANNIGHS